MEAPVLEERPEGRAGVMASLVKSVFQDFLRVSMYLHTHPQKQPDTPNLTNKQKSCPIEMFPAIPTLAIPIRSMHGIFAYNLL